MTKSLTAWLNSDFSLFRINSNSGPEYLSCAGVFRIMQSNGGWRVILHGYLPINLDWFIHGGTMFEVRENPCGRPDDYKCSTLIMRFSDCKIVRKWIRRPVAVFANDVEVVQGCVEMSCDVWICDPEVE